jgi:2-isopropylmalate synthase
VDQHLGTGARPRVIIESARGAERWSTVGCSENIIEASWLALCDGLELALLRDAGPAASHGLSPRRHEAHEGHEAAPHH